MGSCRPSVIGVSMIVACQRSRGLGLVVSMRAVEWGVWEYTGAVECYSCRTGVLRACVLGC